MLRLPAPAVRARGPDVLPAGRQASGKRHSGPGGGADAGAGGGVSLVRAVSGDPSAGRGRTPEHAPRYKEASRSSLRVAQERVQSAFSRGAHVRILDTGIAAGYRFRKTALRAGGSHSDYTGSAPAAGGYHGNRLSRGGRKWFSERQVNPAAGAHREILLQAMWH